jgi:hypothetical protein
MFPNDGLIKAAKLGLKHGGDMAIEESQITNFSKDAILLKKASL